LWWGYVRMCSLAGGGPWRELRSEVIEMAVNCNFANTTGNMNSTYGVVFGQELGSLLSRAQSTTISFGTELEKIVFEIVRRSGKAICYDQMSDVGEVDRLMRMVSHWARARECSDYFSGIGVNLVWIRYRVFKKCRWAKTVLRGHNSEPDYLVIEFRDGVGRIYVMDQKCGAAFDTGKLESMSVLSEISNLIADGVSSAEYMDVYPIVLTSFMGNDKMLAQGIKGKYKIGVMSRNEVTIHRTNVFLSDLGIDVRMENVMETVMRSNFKMFAAEFLNVIDNMGMDLEQLRRMNEANFEVDGGQK